MNPTYIIEFTVTMVFAFAIALFGKGYAHFFLGVMILITGTSHTVNCFNPAVALCFFLNNKINLTYFLHLLALELSGAIPGFILGKYIFTKLGWSA